MGTKRNPGKFDCYAKLADDEPFFVLRAKDPVAPMLVMAWRALRSGSGQKAYNCMLTAVAELKASGRTFLPLESDKLQEAMACALVLMI